MEQRRESLNILLASPRPPPPGGIATWTETLLGQTAESPELVVRHVDTALRWKSIVNTSLPVRLIGGSFQACWDILNVMIAMVRFRPDVLHLTTSAQFGLIKDAWLLLWARLLLIRGVLHIHDPNLGKNRKIGLAFRAIAWPALHLAHRVVALEEMTYRFLLRQLGEAKVFLIPNMIALEEIDAATASPPHSDPTARNGGADLVFVGRVTPEKGVLELTQACLPLAGVRLDLIGPIDRECRARVEQIALGRDQGTWVSFHGAIEKQNVYRLIRKGDIFLLPSHREAFPVSVLEGMALSKPVVATRVGAIPEMIEAGKQGACGVCVEVGDVDSLRNELTTLLSDRENRIATGRNGRRRVENCYSAEVVMESLRACWRSPA